MTKILAFGLWAMLCLACGVVRAQSFSDSAVDKALRFPSNWLDRVLGKTSSLDQQLTKRSSAYLEKLVRREQRMRKRLARVDSVGARQLFGGSEQQYAALLKKMQLDTGGKRLAVSGEYQPYVDSLQGMLGFLRRNPSLGIGSAQVQRSLSQLQQLQAKMKDADQVKALVESNCNG